MFVNKNAADIHNILLVVKRFDWEGTVLVQLLMFDNPVVTGHHISEAFIR